MRANLLTGFPKKSVMLLGWLCSIFRDLTVIPSKQNMGNQKIEGKGGWITKKEEKDRKKEEQQKESESRTWVVKDEKMLEHCVCMYIYIYRKTKYIIFPFISIFSSPLYFLKLSFILGVLYYCY